MRWRALLLVSLGLNVALAGVFLLARAHRTGPNAASLAGADGSTGTSLVRTNVLIRRQFFSWREVESPDYPTYIANLRDIGCPESTIRDIIVADVNQLYALKRATEVVTAEQQWWRAEPDPEVVKAAEDKLAALEVERRSLLTRLLGPNWELTEPDQIALQRPQTLALDGPVLGLLPADVKQAVRQIAARQRQKTQAYLDAQQREGKAPSLAELARIRQDAREDLAKVLSPAQLEEFLLRFSENAQALRASLSQLKYFNATPEEFRSLFRATDQFDQQIQLYYSGDDANSVQQRAALEQQREDAIKNSLGEKRYADYQRLQDPLYRDALATATDASVPQAAGPLYEIAKAAAEERNRIQADPTLTPQQKDIALKQTALEQAKANALVMGQKLPPDTSAPPPPPPLPSVPHVVEPGENLYMLSLRYGVSLQDLVNANQSLDFGQVKPGDLINVPTLPEKKRPDGVPVRAVP